MSKAYTLSEKLSLKVVARNFKDGEKIQGHIKLLNENKKELSKKEFETSVNNYKAKYPFVTEKVAKTLGVNPEEVYYVKGWMDSDNDRTIDYNEEVLLEITEQEEKITVIVELPHSKSTGVGALGLAGHTGIAIGDRYFDYGPELSPSILKDIDEPTYGADFNGDGDTLDLNLDLNKRQKPINQNIKNMSYEDFKNVTTGTQDINALFAPGTAWWAKFIALENNILINDVTLSQTLTFIKNTKSINGNTYIIEFYISKTNANKMIKWWEDKYNKLGIYSIRPYTGDQCTTTVIDSLKTGGINDIDFITLTPQGILEDLKTEVKSTSRQKKGKKAKITLIKNEK